VGFELGVREVFFKVILKNSSEELHEEIATAGKY
jgi:hypothetical protein